METASVCQVPCITGYLLDFTTTVFMLKDERVVKSLHTRLNKFITGENGVQASRPWSLFRVSHV